jgi:hypothetical protein
VRKYIHSINKHYTKHHDACNPRLSCPRMCLRAEHNVLPKVCAQCGAAGEAKTVRVAVFAQPTATTLPPIPREHATNLATCRGKARPPLDQAWAAMGRGAELVTSASWRTDQP